MKKREKIIGYYFLIDVFTKNEFLTNLNFLLKILKEIIKILEVKPVGKPLVKKISSEIYPYTGYSLVQIIQESHLSFHTWPEYNYLAIDIFSCKKIKRKKILDYLRENLPEVKIRSRYFERKINYF